MAKGDSITIKGLKELQRKLKNIPKSVSKEVDGAMALAANDYRNRAVNDAPVDEGILKNAITVERHKELDYEVVSGASWSAYIEFGTKSRVQIPSDLTAYASQFKGKGSGDYFDFLNSILDWVKRKGIVSRYSVKTQKEITKYSKSDNERLVETAQAIANSIIRHGVHPHPFFFKQREVVFEQLLKDISPAIESALNK